MIGLEIIGVGCLILLPGFLHWLFFDRPNQKRLQKSRERNRLFWSIRNKEMDLFGKWLS